MGVFFLFLFLFVFTRGGGGMGGAHLQSLVQISAPPCLPPSLSPSPPPRPPPTLLGSPLCLLSTQGDKIKRPYANWGSTGGGDRPTGRSTGRLAERTKRYLKLNLVFKASKELLSGYGCSICLSPPPPLPRNTVEASTFTIPGIASVQRPQVLQ